MPSTQHLTHTIALQSAECVLSDVWDVRMSETVLPCPWGACVLSGTMTCNMSRQKQFRKFSRGFCNWLCPGAGSGFRFGPKLPHVARYTAQGGASGVGVRGFPPVGLRDCRFIQLVPLPWLSVLWEDKFMRNKLQHALIWLAASGLFSSPLTHTGALPCEEFLKQYLSGFLLRSA